MITTALIIFFNAIFNSALSVLPDESFFPLDLDTPMGTLGQYLMSFNWILPIEESIIILYWGVIIWFYIWLWKVLKFFLNFLPFMSLGQSDMSGVDSKGNPFTRSSTSRSTSQRKFF